MGLIKKFLKIKTANSDIDQDKEIKKDSLDKIKKSVSKQTTKKGKVVKSGNLKLDTNSISDRVLCGPLVTEKAAIAENLNKYSFKVAMWATKTQIKNAVLEIYGIKPIKVSTIIIDGKQVSFRRKTGRRQDYKKTIVTLPKGKTIDIHKGV